MISFLEACVLDSAVGVAVSLSRYSECKRGSFRAAGVMCSRSYRSMQMYCPVSLATAGCSHSLSLSLLKPALQRHIRADGR